MIRRSQNSQRASAPRGDAVDVVNYSTRCLDDHLLRPRFCAGCQWCEPTIKGDDLERRMDQAKGLAGMRCDRGRIVHRDEPGFLVVP